MKKLLSTLFILVLITASLTAQSFEKKDAAGIWKGKIKAGAFELRMIIKVTLTGDSLTAKMDSPDQGAKDIPVDLVTFKEDGSIRFDLFALQGYYEGKIGTEKNKVNGNWYQMGQTFPISFEKTLVVEDNRKPQEPVKPYPYNEEEVTFTNEKGGFTLAGTLTTPKEGKNFPVVILITGSGPQNRNEELLGHKPFLVISDYLTRNGIAVLRYDDRGIGDSKGNFKGATTADFSEDVIAAVNYLKTRGDVIDIKKIGLAGHSEGGLIAPMVAAKNSDVAFIVLLAGPGIPGKEIIIMQTELISKSMGQSDEEIAKSLDILKKTYALLDKNLSKEELDKEFTELATNYYNTLPDSQKQQVGDLDKFLKGQKETFFDEWFSYFLTYDPRPDLKKVKIPVLALNGGLDLQVPPKINLSEIEKALTEAGNKNFKIIEMPKLNHLFQHTETGSTIEYARNEETFSEEVLKIVADWIKETTK